jgi:hypothetical protein
MAEQLTGGHLVERSPEETLAFDTPRLQVNPGPSASHFMLQRRLRLLTKVSAASLRTLEAGDSNLQVKSVAIDESDVTVVVLLCLGDTTLVTYLDVCAPGAPSLATTLRFALEGGSILVRLRSLPSGAWETRIGAIAVTGPFREELARVDAYAQKAAQRCPWSPASQSAARPVWPSRRKAWDGAPPLVAVLAPAEDSPGDVPPSLCRSRYARHDRNYRPCSSEEDVFWPNQAKVCSARQNA